MRLMFSVVTFAAVLFFQPLSVHAEESPEDAKKVFSECKESTPESNDILDITHQYITDTFCGSAAWFDSFFVTDQHEKEIRPGSHLRWTNDFIQTEGGFYEYVTTLRASLRLPKASKKLKLIFEGAQEGSIEDVLPASEADAKTDIGLLYELFQSPRSNLNLKLNLSPKLSLRYRYAYPVSDSVVTRFTQDFFEADDDYGFESRLDLDTRLSDPLLLRWTNIVEDTHLIAGNKWTSALVLFQKLSSISALSYESSVTGLTIPETYNTNARIAVRYRRNFYRKWLFYELVPEVTWPKELITDERQQVAAFTFRLEVNFINM